MRQKFSTCKRLILAALAAATVALTAPALSQDLRVAEGAPSSYTVRKGDTLWGIAGKFLQQPWRWPDIWRLNRDQIKNPHWIYPGDVVRLDYAADGSPRLTLTRNNTVQMLPSVRISALDAEAIPTIPPADLEPYLTRPLLSGVEGLLQTAEIVAGRDRDRVVRGQGDRVYVVGLDPDQGVLWHLYRAGKPLRGIDGQVLGYENRFLGTARIERFAEVSTALILEAKEEILIGDRLTPAPRETIVNYAPHAPSGDVEGRIIASYQDSVEMGRGAIVTIDKGRSAGVDVGTVLAIYRGVNPIQDLRTLDTQPVIVRYLDPTTWFTADHYLEVPQERTGLMFVFRTFDNLSYALILNTTDPVRVGDFVRKP